MAYNPELLTKMLGKAPKTPTLIQMVDDIESVEVTPRTRFCNELTSLQTTDWLMSRERLKRLFNF